MGRYAHPPIRESSGLVTSAQFPDVYWTLNDSGNPPILYATTLSGELIREFPVQGATNRDWEALAIDDRGQLWIGEIGNNSRQRDDLTVYVVAEPDPSQDSTASTLAQYPYRYPDENVDAEGMFIFEGFPYIVSKEPDRAVLYRFTDLQPDEVHVLERVGRLSDARLVTGASLSADGRRLAVCTYDALWIYRTLAEEETSIGQLIKSRPWTLTHDFSVEANGFDGYDLVLTSERRNLYRLPQWWYERELSLPPQNTLSALGLLPQTTVQKGKLRTESYQAAGIDIGGGHVVLASEEPGSSMSQLVEFTRADQYEFSVLLTRGPEYGQIELLVDGERVGQSYDCYASSPVAGSIITFGSTSLTKGRHEVTLRVTGKSLAAREGYKVGLDSYLLRSISPFATSYLVLGPFPKADPGNIDTPLPPEENLNLEGTFQGAEGRAMKWQQGEADEDGRLDLNAILGAEVPRMAVAYALTYVYSPEDRGATLLLGSDDQVAVWIDGQEIHRHNVARGAIPDQDVVPFHLKAGWNEILCKIGQNGGGWALYLRISDPSVSLKYAPFPRF